MAPNTEIHVVSVVLWNRGSFASSEQARLSWVDFVDSLLDLLDHAPEYKSFVLGGRICLVDDYLELRPENRNRLAEHAASGRVLLGPWFVRPNCALASGESLVRNLAMGRLLAKSFANPMDVGYCPDSMYVCGQLAQVFAGFGIEAALFPESAVSAQAADGADRGGRASGIVESPDGSRIFAAFAPWPRPDRLSRAIRGRTESRMPRRFAVRGGASLPAAVGAPVHPERIAEVVRDLRDAEQKRTGGSLLLFLVADMSEAPDQNVLHVIETVRSKLRDDRIFHSGLPEYLLKLKKAEGAGGAKNGEKQVWKGELRAAPGAGAPLPDQWAESRIGAVHAWPGGPYIQRLKAAQYMLSRWAEPAAVAAWRKGAAYPQAAFENAWRTLLRAQEAALEGGEAAVGEIEIAQELAVALRQRALAVLQTSIGTPEPVKRDAPGEPVFLTLHNPSPFTRSEVLEAVVEIPDLPDWRHIALRYGDEEQPRLAQVLERTKLGMQEGEPRQRLVFCFRTPEVPAMGSAVVEVVPAPAPSQGSLVSGSVHIENEFLAVTARPDGSVDLEHKPTHTFYSGLLALEDDGEAGGLDFHLPPGRNERHGGFSQHVHAAVVEDGPARATLLLRQTIEAPSHLDAGPGQTTRSDHMTELRMAAWLTVASGEAALRVRMQVEGGASGHRLRLLLPFGRKATESAAGAPFDVVERPGPDPSKAAVVHPMQCFVDVNDGKTGLAAVSTDFHEYEVRPDNVLALTLLRELPSADAAPQRREWRFHLAPHKGGWEGADLHACFDRHALPLIPIQTGPAEGRQEASSAGLLELEGGAILSGIQRAEDGQAVVVRLYNPTGKRQEVRLTFEAAVKWAETVHLDERSIEKADVSGNSVRVRIPRKKVLAVRAALH
jgi:hypothetical protein